MPEFDGLNTLHTPMASQFVADAYLGPPFVGWILHFILYGCVISQYFGYMGSALHRSDSRRTTIFLGLVVALDTAGMAVNAWETYHYGTSQARDANSIFLIKVGDAIPVMTVGSVGALVQSYLARRAARLFQRRPAVRLLLLSIVGSMIVLGWLASIGSGVMNLMFTWGTAERALPFTYNNVTGTFLWICASVDCLITLALCLSLRTHVTGYSASSDSVLLRIMKLSMRTAACTATCGVLGALVAVAFPQSKTASVNVVFVFISPLGSLYALSLISTLSERIPHDLAHDVTGYTHRVAGEFTSPGYDLTKAISRGHGPMTINVYTEQCTDYDVADSALPMALGKARMASMRTEEVYRTDTPGSPASLV